MKTDDDMYINIAQLHDLVSRNKITYLLTGALICGAKPRRDPKDKYYSPYSMYPGDVYPEYVSGTGYLMSYYTASILFKTSLSVPVFHMEDVYITGILPSEVTKMTNRKDMKLAHSFSYAKDKSSLRSEEPPVIIQPSMIKPIDDYRFSLYPAKYDPCVYSQIISSHHISENQVRQLYADILSIRLKPEKCPKLKPAQLRPYSPSGCANDFRIRIKDSIKINLKKIMDIF